ncbi:MAG: CBS domain-containing protein [Myxococcota bacterium]
MQVREIMSGTPACCTPDTSLEDVARMMVEHDCGCIPVVQPGTSRAAGVVTDRDIVCRVLAQGKNPLEVKAGDCMSQPALTISADETVDACCEKMERHLVRRLVCVDANGDCCGIVAQADVVRATTQAKAAEVVREVSEPTTDSARVH